jgi:hypothetical protein
VSCNDNRAADTIRNLKQVKGMINMEVYVKRKEEEDIPTMIVNLKPTADRIEKATWAVLLAAHHTRKTNRRMVAM